MPQTARSRKTSSSEGSGVEVFNNDERPSERSIGILSQTLSPSPTIRWILPARIRRTSKNDVVFVGENFVQLREFLDNGTLANVTAKCDLGARILAAKVISAQVEVVPFLEQVFWKDEGEVADVQRDEVRYVINGKVIDNAQPPQILVVSLISGDLVFLYAKQHSPGDVRFVQGVRKGLSEVSLPERYGKHLAVDPQSRAMALAGSFKHCGIFNLKRVDEITAEIDGSDSTSSLTFRPTVEDRFIHVDGGILHMEFLPSTSHDPDKVILLLLVVNQGDTSLLLYRWDSRQSLSNMKPLSCSGQRLDEADAFPLMLIPSSKATSFIIVTETALVYYENVTSDEAKRISFSLPKQTPANYDSSSGSPLWVNWAKAPRHSKHRQNNDDFFLIREDGELRYYIVNHKDPLRVEAHFSPGNLGVSVDSAFAMLAGPRDMGGDIFLVGGDMTDGGVYHCTARGIPRLTQVIPNMAPVQDMLTLDALSGTSGKASHQSARAESTFTCSGKGAGHCFINEIRFGIEAQLGWTVENPDSSSTTSLWALEDVSNDRMLLVASHPLQTTVVTFELPSLEAEAVAADSCPGFDLDSTTLALSLITAEVILQITQKCINITSFRPGFTPISISPEPQPILAAEINVEMGLFAITTQSPTGFELKVGEATNDDDQSYKVSFANASHILQHEPIAMCLSSLVNVNILIVSTDTGMLHVFLADAKRGLKLITTKQIADIHPSFGKASASSLQMLSNRDAARSILVCGFRNGKLGCLSLCLERGPPPILRIDFEECFNLGSSTVYVVEDAAEASGRAALAYCGSELRRIAVVADGSGIDFQVTSIWLTDGENTFRLQPTVNAACRIPKLLSADDGGVSGLLLWAAEDELLVSSLVLQEQAVPRRMGIQGTPQRLAYSRYSKKIIVTGNHTSLIPHIVGNTPTRKRIIRPYLQLVAPNGPASALSQSDIDALTIFGEHGERVRCLLNWTPSDGKKHYDMVLIGLDTDAADIDKRSGRVMCISTKYIGSGPGSSGKVKVIARYPGKPVYALCAYKACSLLTAAGNELILQSLDVGSRKWSTLGKFTMPSAAMSLSTHGSFIFAATALHSLVTIKENNNTLTFHASDIRARNAMNVLASPGSCTIITTASDNGTSVLGFSERPMRRRTDQLFEANLPLTIERVRQSYTAAENGSRQQIYATTLDGTVYRFMTLGSHEWQLLRFLEKLSSLRLNKSEPSSNSDLSVDEDWEAVSPSSPTSSQAASHFDPTQMHVQGDILASAILPGPYGLRSLLDPEIKEEDGIDQDSRRKALFTDFERLAELVIGDVEDTIGGTTRWLRKLLRLPQ